jgi:TolB-like protein/Tfp pilus assembly protein PilF
LKRRQVVKAGAAYLVVAWLAVQGASIGFPAFDAPAWVLRVFILVALLGFPVTLVMAWVFEVTPSGMQLDPVKQGTKRMVAIAVALAALAIAWFFYGQASVPPGKVEVAEGTAGASRPKAAPTNPAINPKSIAVLAFTDLSPQHDQEYFSDGMAEEILNALAQVKDLKVAGRTSSFFYKGKNVDIRQIGKALGVAHVLEGSVRKQGDKVRITAQLIQTSDGTHLWSKPYDGDLKDVFKLQEDIARAITDELEVVLADEQKTRLVPVATNSPEAYALYLKATSTFDRRDGPHLAEAAQQLQQAVALDPNYARAWSRLAAVQLVLPTYVGLAPSSSRDRVDEAAKKAIALDPKLAEPWAVLGMRDSYGAGDLLEQRSDFETALRIDPEDVTTNFWFGLSLLRSGYRKQGLARIDHALAIDPMVPNVMRWRGIIALRSGDYDTAEQFLKRAQAAGLKLASRELSELEARRGHLDQARQLWREGTGSLLMRLPPEAADVLPAGIYGGDAAARQRAVDLIEASLAKPGEISGLVPFALAKLGHGARAMEVLQTRVKGDNSDFLVLLFSPEGDSMRALPEYQDFVRKQGFPALWAKYGPPDTGAPK